MKDQKNYIKLNENEIIYLYNRLPQFLARKVIRASIVDNYQTINQTFLEKTSNGNYWVIATENKLLYWLLPKGKLKVSSFLNLDKLKSLFNVEGSPTEESREFLLVKPAMASLTPDGKYWQIEHKGELKFAKDSASSLLETELEQTKEKCEELQQQLEKLTGERNQLQSQVAELAYTKLQEINSYLVTRSEFEKQIKLEVMEREKLSNTFGQKNDSFKEILRQIIERLYRLEQKDKEFRQQQFNQIDDLSQQTNQYFDTESDTQEKFLVEQYNTNPTALLENSIEVNEIESNNYQRRLGYLKSVILDKVEEGQGFLKILTVDKIDYLFPKKDFKINEYNFEYIKDLFICYNYQPGALKFRLIKPAKLSSINKGTTWELIEKGEFIFYE